MLRSWVVVVAVLLVGPRLLQLWNRRQARVRLQRYPLDLVSYEPDSEGTIPDPLRAGFEEPAGKLAALGFVATGYMRLVGLLPDLPRRYAVFWNPAARAFAVVHYRPVSAPLGLTVDFVTLFEDGTWVWTVRGRGYQFIGDFASGRLVDTLEAGLAGRWHLHQAAVAEEGRRAREAELSELCAFQSAREEEELRLAADRGQVVPAATVPGRFYFTATAARNLLRRREEGARRVTTFTGGGETAFANIPVDELERHYRMAERVQKLTRGPTWHLFALSAVAFAASMLAMGTGSMMAWLIPVLLFHELGHWAAMRLLGHADAWIAFIPFFGAATISNKRFDRLSHELIVLLAGPVPGIIVALGLLFFNVVTRFNHPGLIHLAVLLMGINVFNLMPVHPLDGGRILHALVTAGRPRLALSLKFVAAGAFVLAAVAFRDPMTALFAALSVFAAWQEAKLVGVETAIRRAPGFGESATAEARRRLIFAALRGKPGGAPARWLGNVRRLEVPLSHRQTRHWWTVAAGIAYLGAFAAGGLAISRFSAMGKPTMICPARDKGITLACANPTLTPQAWDQVTPARAQLRGTASPPTFSRAAFVWCELPDRTMQDQLLSQLEAAWVNDPDEADCTLPWETPSADSGTKHESSTCSRFSVSNVMGPPDERNAPHRGKSPDVAGTDLPPKVTRFSVRFRDPDDFALIGRYLCGLGCRVDVLPAHPSDSHIDSCF